MGTWVVRPGDYLEQIATRVGVRAEHIWNDPRNAALRTKGRTPTQLSPGDVLHIPATPKPKLAVTPGGFNSYLARIPMVKVPLALSGAEGPMRDEPFEVEGLPKPFTGTTDGEGKATFEVPVRVREVTIFLPKRALRFQLCVGDLDPITEDAGVFARLVNMGFAMPAASGAPSEADVRNAVAGFQQSKGLEATGEIDDATRQGIAEAHGN
ncbi:MAG: LysM peptidoglycan-binding domain-containing protein [Polyangiales bacterium]